MQEVLVYNYPHNPTYPLTSLILRYAINDLHAIYSLRCRFVNDFS